MLVENTSNQHRSVDKPHQLRPLNACDFSGKLQLQQNLNYNISKKIDAAAQNQSTTPDSNNIKLGTLGGDNTTVAQLLLENPALKSKTWSIIHDPINQNKAFHKISAGKEIFYNSSTQELHWAKTKGSEKKPVFSAVTMQSQSKISTTPVSTANNAAENITNNNQKVVLGQINQNTPTISNLLSQQSEFKAQRWNIIHSEVNQNKAFTKIPTGTTIFIDNKTKELSWEKSVTEKKLETASPASDQSKILARKLDDAVKPYMGTEYKHLDCYTLVVNGLENMGIRYRGKGSLSSQLLQRAQLEGRVSNAYFTGEGISEALGDKIYTKAISSVNNIEQQSKAVFKEMQTLMKKGDILSFSLQTKGHTGVISQNKDQWTYINSGRLDNSINTNSPKHGVGEETLLDEINNWIKLAKKRKESLQITVGRIDKQKFV